MYEISLINDAALKMKYRRPDNLEINKEDLQLLELVATHIKKDKRLERMAIFFLGNMFYCREVYAASNIDTLGFKMLGVLRSVGYWICICMCLVEVLKSLMQGDTKGIAKIIVKYLIGFSTLYFLPWAFDAIKESF